MEINLTRTIASENTPASSLKQAHEAHEFKKTLEHIQSRMYTLGKSKVEGKTMTECVQELGILGYARELRIDELRVQIRERVLHDLGITQKQYQGLRSGIRGLKANQYLPQDEIDDLNKMSDKLDKEIEIEVERRLQEHLAAEAKAGKLIINTLAYASNSKECKDAISELEDLLGSVTENFKLLKKKEKGDRISSFE